MTRADLQNTGRTLIMQGYASPLRQYQGPSENLLLDKAADDTAQQTDCYWAEEYSDLVANQAVYCAPKIYKPKLYYTLDENGNRVRMQRDNTRSMDKRLWQWRQWLPQDHPHWVIADGLGTTFTVAPVAIATKTGGIIVAGFAVSTLPAAGRTYNQWDQPGDECPLPHWAHGAVLSRYIQLRLMQLASKDAAAKGLADWYGAEWKRQCGQIEQQAMLEYRSQRRDAEGPGIGGYPYG